MPSNPDLIPTGKKHPPNQQSIEMSCSLLVSTPTHTGNKTSMVVIIDVKDINIWKLI